MPQLVAFLFCSGQLYGQTACFSIEQKIVDLTESNISDYEILTKDLRKCELEQGIQQDKSRLAYHQARIYVKKGNLDIADRIIENELVANKDVKTLLDLKVLKASSFLIKGEIDSCLKLSNEVNNSPNSSIIQRAKSYQYNATCHSKLGNKQYQYNSLIKGLYYAKKTNKFNLISSFYNSLGTYYFLISDNKKDQWKALYFFKRSVNNCPTSDYSSRIVYLINLGNSYLKLNLHERSLSVFNGIYSGYASDLNTEQFFDVTMSLGSTYLLKGNLEKSEFFYQKAFDSLDDLQKITASDVNIYLNLSELELMKGNISKSRSYLRTYVDLNRKYLAKENAEKIIEMQERFYAKDRKAQILRLKNRNQQAKLSYYKLQNGIIVSVVLLGLLITLFFYRQRKKEQALKIERKNELKRAALEASENEKLRFSRDLHDTLGGSLTLISLLVNQAGDKNPDQVSDFNKLYDIVQGSITDLRRVCRDMYPSEILVSGVINSLKNFYLRLGTIHESFNFNFAADDLKLEKGFSVNMYRILQELTNNTFKYADATSVEVNIQKDGEELRILFRDNGKGVELNDLLKGVGLNSIEERTKAYKGSVKFNSSSGNGFTAVMRFPLNEIEEKDTV